MSAVLPKMVGPIKETKAYTATTVSGSTASEINACFSVLYPEFLTTHHDARGHPTLT